MAGDEQFRILADPGLIRWTRERPFASAILAPGIDGEADLAEGAGIRGYDDILVPLARENTVAAPAWSVSQRRESAARSLRRAA